ncbi:caffeic acid 3-O-methyltransferase-like [Gossypium australe]|uniref:Caffeic acid 3-O-methyltransferase-like n=1 Tax=Gossypium australe TaxID=47621 RepID=A0A5B6VL65_9ROSI|nr:caffeic acid 3-O-methyltransferase-like [Gossypium australe]
MIMFSPRTPLDQRHYFSSMLGMMNSWSKRWLSYGGKEVFLKAILQSIPTYAFSILLVPKGIIEEFHSKMSQIWWTSNEKTRGWAVISWNRLCYPKGMRGIGFRDMHVLIWPS